MRSEKQIRKLSKSNRANFKKNHSYKNIIKTIQGLNAKNTLKVTRAFSHFMNLMNLAEFIDASRSLNEYENSKKKT